MNVWCHVIKDFMSDRSFSLGDAEPAKSIKDVIKSIGVVFGDIGTSPVYTMTAIFLTLPMNQNNIFGVTSFICWTSSSSNQVFDYTEVKAGQFKSHVSVNGSNLIFTDYQTYLDFADRVKQAFYLKDGKYNQAVTEIKNGYKKNN